MTRTNTDFRGFTLMELLVVLAIISIIVTLAPAGFSALSRQTSQSAATTFFSDLQFARSEAIKRNQLVGLCPSVDAKHCSSEWVNGYIVFTIDKQSILRTNHFDKKLSVGNSNHPQITFSGDGRCLDRTTLLLTSASATQKIVIYDSGRARIEMPS